MLADQRGKPQAFTRTGGEHADVTQAPTLIERAEQASAFVADKAYDADSLIELPYEKNIEPVIPPRKNRTQDRDFDRTLYKERNLIERLFRRLKDFRRVATRYEKLDRHFAAMIMIACVCVWLT